MRQFQRVSHATRLSTEKAGQFFNVPNNGPISFASFITRNMLVDSYVATKRYSCGCEASSKMFAIRRCSRVLHTRDVAAYSTIFRRQRGFGQPRAPAGPSGHSSRSLSRCGTVRKERKRRVHKENHRGTKERIKQARGRWRN